MKKISALMSLTAAIGLAITGCGGKHSGTQNTKSTATLLSIAVTASNSVNSVAAGKTLQLTATGSYSDGTSQNLTSQATWQTSDSGLATANTSGLLTTFRQG